MIQVVIPCAGRGQRFVDGGYETPKPFIDVLGLPMLERVLRNLQSDNIKFTLILNHEHSTVYSDMIKKIVKNYDCNIVAISNQTEGTACSVLAANRNLDPSLPIVIANSDQLVDINISDFYRQSIESGFDGNIMCFIEKSLNPKWSYVMLDDNEYVTMVQEKKAISNIASVGIYYFSEYRKFRDAAIDMIVSNDRVNHEFYTCPVYNYLIKTGGKVSIYRIPSSSMIGLGTPADLQSYEGSKCS